MNELLIRLKNKKIHIILYGTFSGGGGGSEANYTVMNEADGFIQVLDGQGRSEFCKLDQIKQIIVEKEGNCREGVIV